MLKCGLSLLLAASALANLPQSQSTLNDPSSNYGSLLTLSESAQLLHLHRKLVEIESITGNEHNVAEWLASYLRNNSFTVELQEVSPKRHNVLAYGKKRDTTVLVTSHIDTVPPFWPYYHNETTHAIGGRGSVDAKGSVAPQIMAVQSLREKFFDDLSLLFVVGEETGGDGMRAFSAWEERPKSYEVVIFGEPTEGKLVCGHKGMLGFTIRIQGKAAHSGYPWLGVSANDVLLDALGALHHLRESGLPWSEKYGNTTMNFGRVQGGVAANVVAETAEARIAMRLAAGTPELVRDLILDSLSGVKERSEKLGATLEVQWGSEGYGPVDIDCDLEGFETITVNYGTDLPNLKVDQGVRRYLYGPGSIQVAHSDHEALTRRELERAVLDYRRMIVEATRMDKYQSRRQEERMGM
ncbi:Zn-dependent exopeptidase [Westerdykella ornata]|uniref:Zn-dependent exopeptidase n=1 Tax=Westerdykella ornata TaxID=318751 RepID=A0A6A6JWE1_WESOR|nr:Zn-dependent exopeptidase [Westerdykella ornata]KAF2280940.1 Zn-dependent exopeptidase [Westerdykella ornata]